MKPPITSRKHYVQWSLYEIASVTNVAKNIAHSVPLLSVNTPDEVQEGSVIKAVFLELWLTSSANDGTEVVIVSKTTKDAVGPTYAQAIALDSYNDKKNVLFTHQGLSANDGINNPSAAFRGWIKIPKSKQRFGLGDNLVLSVANPHPTNDLDACGFATYKEYN